MSTEEKKNKELIPPLPISIAGSDPNCEICKGIGYIRKDVPTSHPDFGHIFPCECRRDKLTNAAEDKLFSFSNLNALRHLTFDSFNPNGREGLSGPELDSLRNAFRASQEYAQNPQGWLLLQGAYGCGKTHLAAAIGNDVVEKRGLSTLFITTPDLLDSLRFAYNDPDVTFEQRLNEIRNVPLLIMDDFGTENATRWAQEKLFQILNYRYINQFPTIITTNLSLDELESRIRSRLQDDRLVQSLKIIAPDFRLPTNETSNPGLSFLHLFKDIDFGNFDFRREEQGREIKIRVNMENEDDKGNYRSEKRMITTEITPSDLKSLEDAFHACLKFAEKPEGWLMIIGSHGCGKTHLAASIGNFRIKLGHPVLMVSVSELLDYFRETFAPDSNVRYARRFNEVRSTPLLILDGLGAENTTNWAKEKLFQLLDYRYVAKLPTVITSALTLDELESMNERLISRILDTNVCQIFPINMPRYFDSKYRRTGVKKK